MRNFTRNFKVIIRLVLLIVLTQLSKLLLAQDARWSADFRVGSPTIIGQSTPMISPFGGASIRFSANRFFSFSIHGDGGVITGKSDVNKVYFRNNFIQYSVKGNLNLSNLLPRPKGLERLNVYLNAGAGQLLYYYNETQNAPTGVNQGQTYFIHTAGINIRYYVNEMVDFVAGSDFNFTQTTRIDNVRGNGKYDHYMLNFVGVSLKLLPAQRKQMADWSTIRLPYTVNGTLMASKEVHHHTKEKEVTIIENKASDSLANLLMNQVAGVDVKMDTLTLRIQELYALLNNIKVVNANNTAPEENRKPIVQPVDDEQKETTPTYVTYNKNNPGDVQIRPASYSADEQRTHTGKPSATPAGTPATDASGKSVSPAKAAPATKPTVIATPSEFHAMTKGKYAVVVGSFSHANNANKQKEVLAGKGYEVYILGEEGRDNKRLVIFSNDIDEASSMVKQIRSSMPDAWLLDLNTGKGVYIRN